MRWNRKNRTGQQQPFTARTPPFIVDWTREVRFPAPPPPKLPVEPQCWECMGVPAEEAFLRMLGLCYTHAAEILRGQSMADKISDGEAETPTESGADNEGGAHLVVGSSPADCPRRPPVLDVEACRARCEAATPGPWVRTDFLRFPPFAPRHFICQVGWYFIIRSGCDAVPAAAMRADTEFIAPDTEFIAHARTDLPLALDKIERLRDERDRLQELVDEGRAAYDDLLAERDRLLANAERGLYDADAGRRGD